MSAQLILRIIGIAALVVAVLFAALAVHYYLSQDIRAVMDDLSGKARARGLRSGAAQARAGRGGVAPAARRGGRPAASVRQASVEEAPAAADPQVSAAPGPQAAPMPDASAALLDAEDGTGTMLVAVGAGFGQLPGAASEDDLATMVAPGAGVAEDDVATLVAAGEASGEDDLETMVGDDVSEGAAGGPTEDDLATMVAAEDEGASLTAAAAVPAGIFRMTRSIVMIHSQEIIAEIGE